MFSDLRYRLRALFDRRAMEQELDEELRAHIERETDKYVRAGIARDEAERRARLAFGGLDRIKDDTRDARGVTVVETMLQDLRYAWRGLRAKPGFAGSVVLALGLGIGANAAMFGVIDRLLFRPPAFLASPDRVHRVFIQYVWNGELLTDASLAYRRFAEFAATPAFDLVAAVSERRLAIGTGTDAREMPVAAVSATLFEFFDVRPAAGRFFTRAEDKTPDGAAVVVISHALWQTAFGGSPDVLGKPLHVGDAIYSIVGVAPEGFTGFADDAAPAAFLPVTTVAYARTRDYAETFNWSWLTVFARRRPDVSLPAATAQATATFQRSWTAEGALNPRYNLPSATEARARALVEPVQLARGPYSGNDARVATWVMGVAVIVLLVACANVANLLLARALRRRREIALRLALGVSRRRLIQQLLTESALLAALGGVAGLAIAQWGGRTLRALFLRGEEAAAVVSDTRTLVFVALVTLSVALLTGLAPAFIALRDDVAGSLKAGAREGTYRRSRVRTGLLLFQGALSVVLLVGAGGFVRSLANVRATRLGYDVDPVLAVNVQMRGIRLSPAEQRGLVQRVLDAAETTPGVRSATFAASVPFWLFEGRGMPFVPGADTARIRAGLRYILQAGTARYFETLGTRIVRGRGFTAADQANSLPAVIVNEAMADRLWPGQDPIGKLMRVGGDTMPFLTVVGVAENMRARRFAGEPEHWYFLPWEQYARLLGGEAPTLLVRVNGRAEDFTAVLRRRLQQEMPGAAYVNVIPFRRLVAPTQRSWEFGATMFVAFGGLALVLAAIGLYSVIAYAVAQRTQELGVRMALGASAGRVMRMIVGQGVTFAVAGVVAGGAIALWAGKWLEPLLFSQKARDPVVFAIVAAMLLAVAVVATLLPAWRATRVDPTVALRME